MNLPSASPKENMKIDSSISPMPATRAERWSYVDGFAKRLILDSLKDRARLSGCGHSLHRHSGMVRRTRPGISRFRVRGFASPRNDETVLPRQHLCDTDMRPPLEK